MWRWLFIVLLAVLTVAWEYAITPFLPSWLAIAPVIPILVLLIAFVRQPTRVFVYALLCGLLLDALFAGNGYIFVLWRLALVAGGLILLTNVWVSNRSWFALSVLVVIARLLDILFIWVIAQGVRWLAWSSALLNAYPVFWPTIFWDWVLITVGFWLFTWIKRIVRPYLPTWSQR